MVPLDHPLDVFRAAGNAIRTGTVPVVMGILNVTPDSFFDGGRYHDPAAAVERGHRMVAAGAALIDVGGESTRPGAAAVAEAEEIDRVVPVVERLAADGIAVSVDTYKPGVAAAALQAGAVMVNDVTGLRGGDAIARLCADRQAALCLMHMQGEPRTMQRNPVYGDVVAEVKEFLLDAARQAEAAGVARGAICLDPGIGFGKRLEHNLALLRAVPELAAAGYPVLIGLSRKSWLGELLDGIGPDGRLPGTLAALTFVINHGASLLRVHDVAETVQCIRVLTALKENKRD